MSQSASPGGLGGSHRTGRGIRDTRLVERALRERWPIPQAIRKPLIERLNEIVQDTESSPREITSAARAILAASKLNLESITATIKAQEHEEFEARLAALEKDGQTELSKRIVIPSIDVRYCTVEQAREELKISPRTGRAQPPQGIEDDLREAFGDRYTEPPQGYYHEP